MSRLPQPTSSTSSSPAVRARLKSTPSTPTPRALISPVAKPRAKTPTVPAPSPSTPPLRTRPSFNTLKPKSPVKSPAARPSPALPSDDPPNAPPLPKLSIREQIALKRAQANAQAKKLNASSAGELAGLDDAIPHPPIHQPDQDVDLGRWSIKETIERGRSSGAINLSSRDLPCLPSALFEIHLSVTPQPLKSVPVEPPITTSTPVDDSAVRRKGNVPTWFEAQDLEILKAWSNEIIEIQPEISMFGSLKVIDLHNNKLTILPDTFADLTALTNVNLSHNQLTSLPVNFWALPHLTTLNLSHNSLTALPFGAPFSSGSNPLGRTQDSRGDWFSQSITRATEPLPRLTSLDVSHNQLSSVSIDHSVDAPGLPTLLSRLDLSGNPLGKSDSLFRALGRLHRVTEIHMRRADVGDDSLSVSIFANVSEPLFPQLKILDLEETHVTHPAAEAVFVSPIVKQAVEFEVTLQDPPPNVLRIVVGKRVVKEAWEIEAERKVKQRRNVVSSAKEGGKDNKMHSSTPDHMKESWEIEAEQGMLSEGAKRRARAANSQISTSTEKQKVAPPQNKQETAKEAWEIEAEQGLLTAGGRRRARAEAAVSNASAISTHRDQSRTPSPSASSPSSSNTPPTVGAALANPQYYDAASDTLTLPPSTPPSKSHHMRSFSLAAPAWSKGPTTGLSELTLAIPAPTLPLTAIVAQPLAHTLKVLILKGRRADPSFSIPSAPALCLPCLEELSVENCSLGDNVPVARDGSAHQRVNEPLLSLLAGLFPSLRTLDLSYNALTSAAFDKDSLTALVFADTEAEGGLNGRKGLRQLRLRGNQLMELDAFQQMAERFKGNRDVPEWKLEELDLRDNAIGKLPPELGLLPLDVFLVDGNTFRVPPRRVWEREGTKGLLSWLRGRIE